MKSIAIFGGNGFLGRKLCQTGVARGWDVTALSRSGTAPHAQSLADHTWISKVKWQKADLFEPESYKEHIKDKNAVVHSVGLLFENQDYKTTLNLNFNFLNEVQKLANAAKGLNPMARDSKGTYGAIQRDLAVMLADAFQPVAAESPAFVYISADQKIPVIPDEYITTKREAELELLCKPGLRAILMRPGFMYDAEEPLSNTRRMLGALVDFGHGVKQVTLGDLLGVVNKLVRPAVLTEDVARVVFEKLESGAEGVVTLEEIRHK